MAVLSREIGDGAPLYRAPGFGAKPGALFTFLGGTRRYTRSLALLMKRAA
jgi:hypothetical protein